jgi:hypothetical protein
MPNPATATRTLQATIAHAITLATRNGLSHADCALITLGTVADELRQRLGDDWVRVLVGVVADVKAQKR